MRRSRQLRVVAAGAVLAAAAVTIGLVDMGRSSSSIPSTVYYVSASGNDANSGTSPDAPWATIAKANAAVEPGSTVVLSGSFEEQAIAPVRSGAAAAPITYQAGPGGATLDRPGLAGGTPYLAYFDDVGYVAVDGISFTNSDYVNSPVANEGVVLRSSNHITISRCTFDHVQMQLIGSDDNQIVGNTWRSFVASYVDPATHQPDASHPWATGDMLDILGGSDRNTVQFNDMRYAGHSLIEIGNGTGVGDVNAANEIADNVLSNPWYKDLILSDDGAGTVAERNELLDANSAPALYSTVPGQAGRLQRSSAAVQFSGRNFTLRNNTISNAVCTYGCITLGSRWYVDRFHPDGVLVESVNNEISANTVTGNKGAAAVSFVEFLGAGDVRAGRERVPRLTGNRVLNNALGGNTGTADSWNGSTSYSTFLYHSATEARPWRGYNGNTVSGNVLGNRIANVNDVTYRGRTSRVVQSLRRFQRASAADAYGNRK